MSAWFVGSNLQSTLDKVGPSSEHRQCRIRDEKGVPPQ